jgi:hypothetical protein
LDIFLGRINHYAVNDVGGYGNEERKAPASVLESPTLGYESIFVK